MAEDNDHGIGLNTNINPVHAEQINYKTMLVQMEKEMIDALPKNLLERYKKEY